MGDDLEEKNDLNELSNGVNFASEKVFVVIPAYNEAEILERTLSNVIKYAYSVVVIDDGSTDRTQDVLRSFPVYRVRHRINLGQGAALQTGMHYALSQGAQFIVHFDADGQHRPEDIERLLKPVLEGEAEIALGSRFLRAQDEKEIPLPRRFVLRIAVFVNFLLTGVWLTDAHNGFRVLKRRAAEKIYLHENGYSHASEIIQQIKEKKIRYKECPVRIRYTKYSQSKQQSFWNGFNIIIDMILRGILK